MFFETECFLLFFLFLLTVKKLGYKSPLYLKRALRAKLLTAEAPDTLFTVYFRLFLFDGYSLCGTYSRAHTAADAHIGNQLRLRAQNCGGNSSEHLFARIFLLAEKLKGAALNYTLKVVDPESVGASDDNEVTDILGYKSATVGGIKYRKLLSLKAEKLGGKHIKRVWRMRSKQKAHIAGVARGGTVTVQTDDRVRY